MTRFLLPALMAALLVLSPTAAAQMMDDDETMDRADLERLARDLDRLDGTTVGNLRADYDALSQSYDELRETRSGADLSDPVAARRVRADYDQRYDRLSSEVYRTRLSSARNRADFNRAATDRIATYDDQIRDLRTRYDGVTGDDRADYARDLIRLRAQRDAYRDQVYSARGMTRTRFDDATRLRATDALTRADADFNRARRDAMTRSMDGRMDMDGSSM